MPGGGGAWARGQAVPTGGDNPAFNNRGGGGRGNNQRREFRAKPTEYTAISHNMLPGAVSEFLRQFRAAMRANRMGEMRRLYLGEFHALTKAYFRDQPWPTADEVRLLLTRNGGETRDGGSREELDVFLTLYAELYYRHLYQALRPTLAARRASWHNYRALYNMFIDADSALSRSGLQLPIEWLYDMLDEFVYQFQEWCQFRARGDRLTEEDVAALGAKDCVGVWNVKNVNGYLEAIADASQIADALKRGELDRPGMLHVLGYFALVSAARVHVLAGDPGAALQALGPVDLRPNKRGIFARVTACHITLHYYLGFAYFGAQRYVDAIKTLSSIVLYLHSTNKQHHTHSYAYEQVRFVFESPACLLACSRSEEALLCWGRHVTTDFITQLIVLAGSQTPTRTVRTTI